MKINQKKRRTRKNKKSENNNNEVQNVAVEPVKHAEADPNTLYVGNLSWTVTDDDLKTMFSPYGAISTATVAKAPSGRSKGFGLVKFTNVASAHKALMH